MRIGLPGNLFVQIRPHKLKAYALKEGMPLLRPDEAHASAASVPDGHGRTAQPRLVCLKPKGGQFLLFV
jgi:hypothetical protein